MIKQCTCEVGNLLDDVVREADPACPIHGGSSDLNWLQRWWQRRVEEAEKRRFCPDSPHGRHLWMALHTTTSISVFDPLECEFCGQSR